MKILKGPEHEEAIHFMEYAADIAKASGCLRSRCGSVIVATDKQIIGQGFNSPPCKLSTDAALNLPPDCIKDSLPPKFKSDKTCCLHAEQRAIMQALKDFGDKIKGSRLYFIRLGNNGSKLVAGQPFCTICSKMALDAGIAEFVLWHADGITVYDTEEYNELSFQYNG